MGISGRMDTYSLWIDGFDSDCTYVENFVDEVNSMYQGDDTFSKCAKIEADKVLEEVIKDCSFNILTPEYCAAQGKEAAAIIMAIYTADFCAVKNKKKTETEPPSIEEMCED